MSLSATGFVRPRLAEIKADYDERFRKALGPVNTNPDSVTGQMIGIFSAALDDAYEVLQNTYDAMYPFSAEGTSLDGAVAFVGLERLGAAPTSVVAMCYGNESTLIPAGALARAADNTQYATTAGATISRSAAGDANIEVRTLQNSALYRIITNGVEHDYTSDANATADEIIAGLAATFDPLEFKVTVAQGVLTLRAADLYSDFVLSVDAKLVISRLATPMTFTAIETGARSLPVASLATVDSSVVGWLAVLNLVPGAVGRDVETDEELRRRHLYGTQAIGAATVPAIRARLLSDVPGVSFAAIYENRTHLFVDTMPPHSFIAVVNGGLAQAVADTLFRVKPAGIETWGSTALQVLDDSGDMQLIRFSRPVVKYAWVRVTVIELNDEEALTVAVDSAIASAVVAYGNAQGIGEDIIVQRFFGPIFLSTTGLATMEIEVALTTLPTDVPVYSSSNIPVDRAGLAEFDISRVTVLGV